MMGKYPEHKPETKHSIYLDTNFMRIDAYIAPPLFFALVGPSVGATMFILLFAIGGIVFGNLISVSQVAIMLICGYLIGLVPALLAGIIYVMAWNTRGLVKSLETKSFGAVLGAASGLIAHVVITAQFMKITESLVLSIFSVVSGAVSGWFAADTRNVPWGKKHQLD